MWGWAGICHHLNQHTALGAAGRWILVTMLVSTLACSRSKCHGFESSSVCFVPAPLRCIALDSPMSGLRHHQSWCGDSLPMLILQTWLQIIAACAARLGLQLVGCWWHCPWMLFFENNSVVSRDIEALTRTPHLEHLRSCPGIVQVSAP